MQELQGRAHTDVRDEWRQGRHSLVTENSFKTHDQVVSEEPRFTISDLSDEFPRVWRTSPSRMITERLDYEPEAHEWGNQLSGYPRRSVLWDYKSWCHGMTSVWIRVATNWKSNIVIHTRFACNYIFLFWIFLNQQVRG